MPAAILFGTADRVIDTRTHGDPMRSRIDRLDFEAVGGLGQMSQFNEPERVIAFIKRLAIRAFSDPTSSQLHDNFKEPSVD
ncbi:hypothetical protein [Mesorhizobium sp. CO1-1-8]|uniref:hypothetical protein n=1 Tax=Mesorhizobium sp. CO1-1-8 TaxID=2876631 RepID=UPI001CD1817F|nr:hypothetical protein [Mesorhizobium sp. CO1-1-8]MBZ9771016.1 hypothetical protein [Mesorhizobium sp. CO1-1-8]